MNTETILSYLIIIFIAIIGIYFSRGSSTLFRLIPFSVFAGALFLIPLQNESAKRAIDIITSGWSGLPAIMISIVFATLFLGKKIIGIKKIWSFAGPQIVFGQTLAWGQYVVGSLLALFILVPIFNMSPLSAALIEISFEGGHGTAAGLGSLFDELGFSGGKDLALGLATVGIVVGLLSGFIMIAVAKRGKIFAGQNKSKLKNSKQGFRAFIIDSHNTFLAHHVLFRTVLQLCFVGLAVLIGYLIKLGMLEIEVFVRFIIDIPEIVKYIPLFPLAMIGGIALQISLTKFRLNNLIHSETIAFIGALALEIVIVAAIATMSLASISDNIIPFALLGVVGTIWNLLVLLILAPRIMHKYWFERAIGDYGQSMGMTATGLVLMRSADRDNKSQALERFGYKQLLFEPIVGGGLFTASAMIIISNFGLSIFALITSLVTIVWIILGMVAFSRKKTTQT